MTPMGFSGKAAIDPNTGKPAAGSHSNLAATPSDPVSGLAHARPVEPYGLFGLSLSIVVIGLFAAVYTAAFVILIYGCVFDGAHLDSLIRQLAASLEIGSIAAFIGCLTGAATASLSAVTASLAVYLAVALAVLTLARIRGGRAWRSLIAWKPWALWRAGRAYWFIGGGALVYSLVANALLSAFYPPSQDWFKVPRDNVSAACQLFILAAIFAPITEELLFRGWIYTALRARLGMWISLFISSAIFAGLHYEDTHIYALAVFPIGMALGGLRETSGSLKASMSFHAFFNAVAFGLSVFDLG